MIPTNNSAPYANVITKIIILLYFGLFVSTAVAPFSLFIIFVFQRKIAIYKVSYA